MSDVSNDFDAKPTENFNALYLERKLVELVEEVRLRRNLEAENEKTLKSVMDEKYQQDLSWDEKMRRHSREKEDLEQQIDLLKRKLEDKVCVSDEDKAKQQIMNKTYSHEIRQLKEELRVSKSEKLNLQKKIQELEGKLKLHDNLQDSILNQVSEVRRMMKTIFEESKELMNAQKKVIENVESAKFMFKKFDLCNQHLQQCIEIYGKKNESLQKELISCRSEFTLLKQSVPTLKEKNNDYLEIEKLQNKILCLENLLLTSRQENVKTLDNFLESNQLLCKFMDKYSDFKEREKQLSTELQIFQGKLHACQTELQSRKDEIKEIKEKAALNEKQRIENLHSIGIQTETISNQNCSCSKQLLESFGDKGASTFTSFIPKAMEKNFMDEITHGLVNLEQNALMLQSEMSVNNGIHSFSLDQLCVNSADKKIMLSQVLKRKLEIMESGNHIEMASMKKRFTENLSQSMIVVENGAERNKQDKMFISCEANYQPFHENLNSVVPANSLSFNDSEMLIPQVNCQLISKELNSVVPMNSSSLDKNEKIISHKADCQILYKNVNSIAPVSPSCVTKNALVMSHDVNKALSSKLNLNISSSSVKHNVPVTQETYDQSSCSNLNLDVPLCPPIVDILLDQKYLSDKKFSLKTDKEEDNDNKF